jgi:ribosome-binding ATPase YchF (GTP1/OBG family)
MQGEGLGNAFLSHIKAVDGIFHVVRIFEQEDITHVEGGVDPIRDMEIIHEVGLAFPRPRSLTIDVGAAAQGY